MASYEFTDFNTKVNSLIAELPAKVPDWEIHRGYTDDDIQIYRKIVIFVHAEIEAYLEGLLIDSIEIIEKQFKESGIIHNKLATLIYRVNFNHDKIKDMSLEQYIDKSIQQFKDYIKSNHGIKDTNIRPLFKMLGLENILEHEDIPVQLIPRLNTLSKVRGEFVHRSSLEPNFVTYIKPDELRNDINEILIRLEQITNEMKRQI